MAAAMSSRSGSHARSRSGAYGGGVGGGADPLDRRVEVPEAPRGRPWPRSRRRCRTARPPRARSAAGSSCAPTRGSAPCRAARRCAGRSPRPRCLRRPARSAAASASCTIRDTDTTVTSVPGRTTADLPIGSDVVGRRLRSLHAVEQPVLDEDHRVRVLDRGAQQAVGVGRRRRHDDGQPGDVREQRLEALRVLAARRAAGAELGAHGQRHLRRRRRS